MHQSRLSAAGLSDIADKLSAGARLDLADGVRLFEAPDLLAVGWLANREREKRHGGRTYYNFNLRLEATNVCVASCLFCSFSRLKPGDPQAYFEREYIRGIATDKLPAWRFESEEFALGCARLLGVAAAPNLIVGRCDIMGIPLFDDGDEVMLLDSRGMPADIIVTDHTGTFNDYASPLAEFTPKYALPVTRRAGFLVEQGKVAEAYMDAFDKRFHRFQDDYRRRRKAFDSLFAHLPGQEPGSFAYRWRRALSRLDETDPKELVGLIRGNCAREASGPS
jgi:hypothetical protein